MSNELKVNLEKYIELKNWIINYNKEQLEKGLDLSIRIMNDLIKEYPNKIGEFHVKWENDWRQDELVLKIGTPFDNNGNFFSENKGSVDYVVERYPDAEKHYMGILVAKCINLHNVDNAFKKLQEETG